MYSSVERSNAILTDGMRRFRLQVWRGRLADLNQRILSKDATVSDYPRLKRERDSAMARIEKLEQE